MRRRRERCQTTTRSGKKSVQAKSCRCRQCEQARRQRCSQLGAPLERSEQQALAASGASWEEEKAPTAVRVPASSRARLATEDTLHPLLAGEAAHSRPKTPCRPVDLSHQGCSMQLSEIVDCDFTRRSLAEQSRGVCRMPATTLQGRGMSILTSAATRTAFTLEILRAGYAFLCAPGSAAWTGSRSKQQAASPRTHPPRRVRGGLERGRVPRAQS